MNIRLKFFDNQERNIVLFNFLSLGMVQGLNFLLPLLVVPYLLYTLGVEMFGLLAMATAFIGYFMMLSDYGFNITATREISVHRDNPEKLNEIVSAVVMIKIGLMLVGFLILLLSLLLFDTLGDEALIYLLTFGMVMGQVFFPIWFFQGMEKMGYIALLNIVAKLFFLIALLLLVKEREDAYLVPLLNSLGFIVVGFVSLFYMYKVFHIRLVWQPYHRLRHYLVLGWHVFLSRMAVVFYTSSNIFILGLFTSHTVVGYYAIADKVVSALVSLGDILNQAFFPYLSKKWGLSHQSYYRIFYKILRGLLLSMVVLAVGVAWWASDIVSVLSGEEMVVTTELLQIMSLTIILFPLGGLFSQSFVTQQQSVYVTKSTFWTLLVNLILVGTLIPLYGVYGLAFAMILVQVFHFYLNYVYFNHLQKVARCVV